MQMIVAIRGWTELTGNLRSLSPRHAPQTTTAVVVHEDQLINLHTCTCAYIGKHVNSCSTSNKNWNGQEATPLLFQSKDQHFHNSLTFLQEKTRNTRSSGN